MNVIIGSLMYRLINIKNLLENDRETLCFLTPIIGFQLVTLYQNKC